MIFEDSKDTQTSKEVYEMNFHILVWNTYWDGHPIFFELMMKLKFIWSYQAIWTHLVASYDQVVINGCRNCMFQLKKATISHKEQENNMWKYFDVDISIS
jgi:hypothetical protein